MSGLFGGGSQQSNQTVQTQSLPDYARPYYDVMMERAQAESTRPYQPYRGPRLADYHAANTQSDQLIQNLGGSGFGSIDDAENMFNQAGNVSQYQNYAPGSFNEQSVNAQNVNVGPMTGPADVQAGQWGQSQANQYMNPYIDTVLNAQRDRAMQDWQRSQIQRNDIATQSGNFGGGRHGVMDALGREEMTRQLSDINAAGYNQAWNQAQGMYSSDRDAALQAAMANQQMQFGTGQANLNAALQQGISNQGANLQAGLANQSSNLRAQELGEQSRQFGSNLGLQSLQQQLAAGQGLLGAQSLRDSLTLGRANALNISGDRQMAYDQAGLDTAYNDFVNQRDAERQNLGFFSNIFGGVPMGANTTTTQYQSVNPLSQMLGLGIGAYGMYNMYGGGGGGGGTPTSFQQPTPSPTAYA